MYSGAVIAVLSNYPMNVIKAVVDPRTGLPSRSKWLPTIAELKEACEAIVQIDRNAAKRDAMLVEQFARRDEFEADLQKPRPTYEELQARCAKDGLFIGPQSRRTMTQSEKEKFIAESGLTKEQWDAIPDAKSAGVPFDDEATP